MNETGINLDGMDKDELMEFWGRTNRQPVTVARELFPDKPRGYVSAARDLGHYAANKSAAMLCRENGSIQGAMMYESICETIYNRLPEFARW